MTGVLPLSTAWCASFQYERRTTSRYAGSTYSLQISSGSLMCASQSKTGKVLVTRCCPLLTLMGLLRGRRDTPHLPPSCLVRPKEAGQVRVAGTERPGLRRDQGRPSGVGYTPPPPLARLRPYACTTGSSPASRGGVRRASARSTYGASSSALRR